MATATAPRTRAKKPSIEPATPAELHALIEDIKLQERGVEKRVLLRGALAAKNIHQDGPPGCAKSLLCREFCARIGVDGDNLNHFEKTLHPQMPVDALMGAYDMEKLLSESRLERKIEGYMPAADSVYLGELTRANGPVTDALLPIMNTTERLYEANGSMAKSPMLFLVTDGNFLPDPSDPLLGAFMSRITTICRVGYIKSRDSFMQLLREDQARKRGEPQMAPSVFVSLEAFRATQQAVRMVDVTQGEFLEECASLRDKATAAGLIVDDRRWVELTDIARAEAYLAGRDFCTREDLASYEAGLWRVHAEIPTVLELLLEYRSTFDQDAAKFRSEAETGLDVHERLRPVVEGTPPTELLDQEVSRELNDANRVLHAVYKRIEVKIGEAENQQRECHALRELREEFLEWKRWRDDHDLPANWK